MFSLTHFAAVDAPLDEIILLRIELVKIRTTSLSSLWCARRLEARSSFAGLWRFHHRFRSALLRDRQLEAYYHTGEQQHNAQRA
jgi:hypothetical protein